MKARSFLFQHFLSWINCFLWLQHREPGEISGVQCGLVSEEGTDNSGQDNQDAILTINSRLLETLATSPVTGWWIPFVLEEVPGHPVINDGPSQLITLTNTLLIVTAYLMTTDKYLNHKLARSSGLWGWRLTKTGRKPVDVWNSLMTKDMIN